MVAHFFVAASPPRGNSKTSTKASKATPRTPHPKPIIIA